MARDSSTNYAETRAALQDDCGIGDPTLGTVNECFLAGCWTYTAVIVRRQLSVLTAVPLDPTDIYDERSLFLNRKGLR
jgi:hypothetical protein